MKKKAGLLLSLTLVASTVLGACGNSDKASGDKKDDKNIKVGMVTDVGGVDDKSFNQSSWEGLQKFGKDNGLKEKTNYRYLQSEKEADYIPNLKKFAKDKYDLSFGIGYKLEKAIEEVAKENPKQQFAIVDTVVKQPNVTSITFKDHEGSFLVGAVAAMSTKTNKVGFVGGMKSDLISKFENGFKAGAKAVNPNIEIVSEYAEAFDKPEKGAALASAMYGQGVDVIYHAAGGTGNGVFTEAKNRKKKGENVWVIGVDRDQNQEGMPENVTLTSMVKRVDVAVEKVAQEAKDGKLEGGKVEAFGLKDEGVGIAKTTDNVKKVNPEILPKVEEFEKKITAGEIKVPATDKEYKEYEAALKK
ncbi:BMP family ABC transporter substrate-binding protein [Bacillus pseudomycoides]|uniref:BMP family ABC transporter substrate-binding protein n=1 Tax=Bacillus pseudomycoides TaxID=64104 RepID=A0AA91VH14_9BACI|nr:MULTISPECIES: BMP family protein [Bacillus]PEB55131.1 BMP family ABC transporter substrate-binding protein [Bacillus sp. AFS098217]PED84155.1 BMP family ABC transporter substrate-binding protein [Bacillus pseudomycoides]PEU15681.1 BMP family ABC transporter substrate-binding protein [Bacillus sp. AFS019443]PEU21185.1 BMP family ABC transporter substrate-binding protein [Bacillus sp. AFS014408]PFW65018.1 BMP family ABC transporter substrate-binding protein [Bacillus sp. AFS075034]